MGKRLYSVDDTFLDVFGSHQAWFVGLMAADGCINSENSFGIAQSSDHGKKIVSYLQELLGHTGNISRHKNSYGITITSKRLVERLLYYGVFQRKSLSYTFPRNLPIEYFRDFLRGYIDGDGSVGVYNVGRSPQLLVVSFVGTKEFIFECGKFIPVKCCFHEIKHAKNLFEIRFNGKKAIEFGEWLWENKDLYKYYKQDIYENFMKIYAPGLRFLRYKKLREIALRMLIENIPVKKIEKEIGVRFQTIYKWKKEYGKSL